MKKLKIYLDGLKALRKIKRALRKNEIPKNYRQLQRSLKLAHMTNRIKDYA